MVKLHQKTTDNTIHIDEMQDGQIAIIVCFNADKDKIGMICQRIDKMLIMLGQKWGKCHDTFFEHPSNSTYRVRILQKGELIEIC